MSNDLEGPHWRWSLRVYSQPGVSEACLTLQDRCGVDVNVLLLALFAALRCRARVTPAEIEALDRASAPIREEVVEPLRAVRRHMKTAVYGSDGEAARNKVKAAELAAEQLQQSILAGLVAGWPAGQKGAHAREVVVAAIRHYEGDPADVAEAIDRVASAADAEAGQVP